MPYNKMKPGSKMFLWATHTVNFVTGCHHRCEYNCWARKIMLRTSHEFEAHRKVISSFNRFPGKDARIATNLLGDAFCNCDAVPEEWMAEMFGVIRSSDPSNEWLLQTKNPVGFLKYLMDIPNNCLLGVTIESDIDHLKTHAPTPETRFLQFLNIPPGHRKFLSIEPVMKFNTVRFLSWIRQLKPEIIELGADNYGSNLPEPSKLDLEKLITGIGELDSTLHIKPSLGRLLD